MGIYIDNVRAVFPEERIVSTTIRLDDGKVVAIGDPSPHADDEVVHGKGRLLTPGLIDMHVHGIMHSRFDGGPDELLAGAEAFARFGTTTVLPTAVPKRGATTLNNLEALAGALERVTKVNMPGLHLEGPFMALPGAGCDVVPGDLGLLDELLAACRGRVQVMSLSPDTPNILPVIERLREEGIVPFVTHTAATLQQTQAAIAAGARHATHFYDVFPVPPATDGGVRPVGTVEAFLANPDATVDFIADGCHVDPIAIQLAVRAKSCLSVAIITDGNVGAGLPAGEYPTPWGYPVRVEPGNGARIADPDHPSFGLLAGSALTMNVGMANVLDWLDEPPEMVWAMGTTTPARIAALPDKGSLAVGADADVVLWNDDLNAARTWVKGEQVYNDPEEC
ncbi:MAG: amidohydrolase family protein [Candidatus Pacebacteria bacterium]|nr:amidohydrolase family protein [Candidatus Paceibacterota bacterium]